MPESGDIETKKRSAMASSARLHVTLSDWWRAVLWVIRIFLRVFGAHFSACCRYGTAQEACPRILYDYVPSMTTFPFLHLTKLFAISANRVPLHHRNRSGSYNAYSITLVSILLLSRRKGVFFMPIVMEDDCMFTH
jgi:hypothetical protein